MNINPNRLRELRKRMKLSRQALADKSKISPRHLSRLESNSASSGAVREGTVNQLAKALDVEPGVFLGELPLPESTKNSHHGTGERMQVSAQLLPKVHLACALNKEEVWREPHDTFQCSSADVRIARRRQPPLAPREIEGSKGSRRPAPKLGIWASLVRSIGLSCPKWGLR